MRDRGDGLRGTGKHANQGKRAVTHVEVVQRFAAQPAGRRRRPPVTLCRVRLETGKTHQIRIHLAERGHPLIGERVYIRDYTDAGREPLESARLLLHARTLGFEHPLTGARVACEAPLPDDFRASLAALDCPLEPA